MWEVFCKANQGEAPRTCAILVVTFLRQAPFRSICVPSGSQITLHIALHLGVIRLLYFVSRQQSTISELPFQFMSEVTLSSEPLRPHSTRFTLSNVSWNLGLVVTGISSFVSPQTSKVKFLKVRDTLLGNVHMRSLCNLIVEACPSNPSNTMFLTDVVVIRSQSSSLVTTSSCIFIWSACIGIRAGDFSISSTI